MLAKSVPRANSSRPDDTRDFTGQRQDGRDRRWILGEPGEHGSSDCGVVPTEDLVVNLHHRRGAGGVGHPDQLDSGGGAGGQIEAADVGDQQRLRSFGHESCRGQPRR